MTGFTHYLTSALSVDAQGNISGKLEGANCYGEEKVRRIKEWFQTYGVPEYIYAYGDTKGDIPMLTMANEGYWVKGGIQLFKPL